MSKVYKLPLVLTPQPEGGYTVTCPVLPELMTECNDLSEGIANAQDALEGLVDVYEQLGKPLPPAMAELDTTSPVWVEALLKVS